MSEPTPEQIAERHKMREAEENAREDAREVFETYEFEVDSEDAEKDAQYALGTILTCHEGRLAMDLKPEEVKRHTGELIIAQSIFFLARQVIRLRQEIRKKQFYLDD